MKQLIQSCCSTISYYRLGRALSTFNCNTNSDHVKICSPTPLVNLISVHEQLCDKQNINFHFRSILAFLVGSSIQRILKRSFREIVDATTEMGKKTTAGGFYAVARGKSVGIYMTWDECKAQVNGFPNARYKKFPSRDEAETFITENGNGNALSWPSSSIPKQTSNAEVDSSSSSSCRPSSSFFPQLTPTTLVSSALIGGGWGGGSRGFNRQLLQPPRKTAFCDPLPLPMNNGGVRNFAGQVETKPFNDNKRSLKVTEDRVTGRNKRLKADNSSQDGGGMNLSGFEVDSEGYVVVYTDGACRANGKNGARAGIGVWFGDSHSLNIAERVKGRQTNNTAEIQAAERAIRQAKQSGISKLKLMTDSQFTINCATKWMSNWKRNGWKRGDKSDVKNKEDLEQLDSTMQGIEVKWSYIEAHKGHLGNEAADRLAVEGSLKC